ncbi:hypothetical protein ACFLT7_04400 [candidate division KSB1 bacterium]
MEENELQKQIVTLSDEVKILREKLEGFITDFDKKGGAARKEGKGMFFLVKLLRPILKIFGITSTKGIIYVLVIIITAAVAAIGVGNKERIAAWMLAQASSVAQEQMDKIMADAQERFKDQIAKFNDARERIDGLVSSTKEQFDTQAGRVIAMTKSVQSNIDNLDKFTSDTKSQLDNLSKQVSGNLEGLTSQVDGNLKEFGAATDKIKQNAATLDNVTQKLNDLTAKVEANSENLNSALDEMSKGGLKSLKGRLGLP